MLDCYFMSKIILCLYLLFGKGSNDLLMKTQPNLEHVSLHGLLTHSATHILHSYIGRCTKITTVLPVMC